MYRCPNCHCELPAAARFCNKCGFTQIRTTISSPAQTQQELSPASSHPVQLPTDASSSLPSPQAPKRIVQPTAKRTPAACLRLPAAHADEPRSSLLLPQAAEEVDSSLEQNPVPPIESVHTPQSEDDLHLAQTAAKEEDKPGLIHPIGTNTPSKPDRQPAAPVPLRTKLLGQSVPSTQPAQPPYRPVTPIQPSLWIPGTLG